MGTPGQCPCQEEVRDDVVAAVVTAVVLVVAVVPFFSSD